MGIANISNFQDLLKLKHGVFRRLKTQAFNRYWKFEFCKCPPPTFGIDCFRFKRLKEHPIKIIFHQNQSPGTFKSLVYFLPERPETIGHLLETC